MPDNSMSHNITLASEIVSHDQPGFYMLKTTVQWPSSNGHAERAELYAGVFWCKHILTPN